MAVYSRLHRAGSALFAAWLVLAAFAQTALQAQLPITQMRVLYPPMLQAGGTATAEVLGHKPLDEIDRLVFSHPGISANVLPGETNALTGTIRPQYGKFQITVSADVPTGFYEVWGVGRNGASVPRVFWVAPRAQLAAPQPANDQQPVPQLTPAGIIVDRYVAAKVQRYDLPLEAGKKVRVSVVDARIDSRALTELQVLGPDARPVTAARSTSREGASVEITADQAGTYRIELRDAIYRGGDEFFYALVLDPADAPTVNIPTAAWANREMLAKALAAASGQVPATRELTAMNLSRYFSPEHAFFASPPDPSTPLAVTLPCLISGTFGTSASGQAFEFTAKKGDAYWIDVASQQLDQNTDPHLSIFKVTPAPTPATATAAAPGSGDNSAVKLDRIAEQDDPAPLGTVPFRIVCADPSLRFDAPEDATYRIVVRDQLASNAATAGGKFLISVRKPQPSLSVIAAWASPRNNQAQALPTGNNLMLGSAAAVRVLVQRCDGLSGPVEVLCEGLPAGVSSSPIVIPADRDEGHLVLTCADAAEAFAGPVKIVVRHTTDPNIPSQVLAATLTWEPIPTWNALERRLSGQLTLTVNSKDTSPLTFNVGSAEPLVMARGGKLPIPIKVTRREGGKDKITLRAQNLPTKVTLADVPIEPAASEATPELLIAADAPLGEASIWFQAETKVKFRVNPQAYERAEAERAQLEKLQADPAQAEKKDAIAAALKAATDLATQLKAETAEKDVPVFLPTNTVRLKIVDAPFEPMAAWRIEAKRGSEADYPLGINRLFAFEDEVKLALVAPLAGCEITVPAIAAKAPQTALHLKVAADAMVGEHPLQLKLTYKFNNQDLSATLPLTLVISE